MKSRGSETILFFWFLLIQFKQYLYCFALFKLTFQALRTVSYRSLSLSSKTDWLIFIIMYLKTGSIYSCLDKELCNTSVFIMPLSCLQIQRRTDKKKDLARDLLLSTENPRIVRGFKIASALNIVFIKSPLSDTLQLQPASCIEERKEDFYIC